MKTKTGQEKPTHESDQSSSAIVSAMRPNIKTKRKSKQAEKLLGGAHPECVGSQLQPPHVENDRN